MRHRPPVPPAVTFVRGRQRRCLTGCSAPLNTIPSRMCAPPPTVPFACACATASISRSALRRAAPISRKTPKDAPRRAEVTHVSSTIQAQAAISRACSIMTGRAYASYPVAFKYRKTLVQGCQCRPQPWTEAELARHRAYAAQTPKGEYSTPIADARTGPSVAPLTIYRNGFEVSVPRAPGSYSAFDAPPLNPSFVTQDDLRAVARPTPVQRQPQAGQWEWFSDTGPTGKARSRYDRPGPR